MRKLYITLSLLVLMGAGIFMNAQNPAGGYTSPAQGGPGGLPTGLTFVAPTLTVSTAGSGNGQLALSGNTSGVATITAPPVAGTATNLLTISNGISVPNGFASNPTYTFAGSAGSGLFFNGSAQPAMAHGSSQVAFWATGLGTTTVGMNANGTAAGLTGTGACATVSTTVAGAWAGNTTCTGTTGASTLIITPGWTAAHAFVCYASDLTTAANALRQSAQSTTTCTIAGTVNASDVLTFIVVGY